MVCVLVIAKDQEYRENTATQCVYSVVRVLTCTCIGTSTVEYTYQIQRYSVDVPMEESEDPLEWELRQMQHLQKLADMYAWGTGEAKYLQRVKLIQQEGEARMKASKASHGVANSRVPPTAASTGAGKTICKRDKPYGWKTDTTGPKHGRRCSSFSSAMKFLGAAPYGAWESDRDSPSGKGWRRYIAVDPEDETIYTRARIQTAKGWPS